MAKLAPHPLAEARFAEYVDCYARRATVANVLRMVLSGLAVVVETGTPIAIFVGLDALGTPFLARVLAGALSFASLVGHYATANGEESWKRRSGVLTAIAAVAGALPLAARLVDLGFAKLLPQLDDVLHVPGVAALLPVGTAVATAAAGTLLAVLVARGCRRARCRVLAMLMARKAREQMVCELVQSIDLIMYREMARQTDRPMHQRVVAELLDSTIHLYGRGRLVASMRMTRSRYRSARKEFVYQATRLELLRDDFILCRGNIDHGNQLSHMAAALLMEQEDYTGIMESRPSRFDLALQVLAILLGLGVFAVVISLLSGALGLPIGGTVTVVATGLVTTMAGPALKRLVGPDVDLTWMTKLFGSGDGADKKGEAKQIDHEGAGDEDQKSS